MPDGSDSAPSGITRRQGLLALAVIGPLGLLAACTDARDAGPPSGTGTPSAAADDVAQATADDEQALISRYDGALATLPALDAATAALLTAIRDEHVQHRDALGVAAATPSPAGAAPSPTSADVAIHDLARAERQASRHRIQACLDARDPELARLLAFIGASEASHAPALRDVRG